MCPRFHYLTSSKVTLGPVLNIFWAWGSHLPLSNGAMLRPTGVQGAKTNSSESNRWEGPILDGFEGQNRLWGHVKTHRGHLVTSPFKTQKWSLGHFDGVLPLMLPIGALYRGVPFEIV